MKTIAIIQARMGSSRLPGKVLLDICGQPMLARVVSRVSQASALDEVIVATSTSRDDDQLALFCERYSWSCFRGSQLDVLDRFYRAASAFRADVIVRVSADCPLIDPEITDQVAAAVIYASGQYDYAANMLPPRTFPRGVDVEAFTFEALERTWHEAEDASSREHVTPWIYHNPDRFRVVAIKNDTDESEHRWTVDVPEDLEVVRLIFGHFGSTEFRWRDVVDACRQNPEWFRINAHIQQRAA